jgi:glycosyltransferase involved in cell wall biosynthesis
VSDIDNAMNWPATTFILIPSYRAFATLGTFLDTLQRQIPPGNICVVDDASHDGTDMLCRDKGVLYTAHEVNRGKGASLTDGFKLLLEKGAEWIVTMDADGQHAPQDLPKFLDAASRTPSAGIIAGARVMKPGVMPFFRILSNRITSALLSAFAGARIDDSQCGYRNYSGALLREVDIRYNRFEMESEIILKAAFLEYPVIFIPVQTLYLEGQKSHISHFIDTIRWTRAVLKTWVQCMYGHTYRKKRSPAAS